MSYILTSKNYAPPAIKIRGGRVHYTLTPNNPDGKIYAQCEKHPKYFNEVLVSVPFHSSLFLDLVMDAAQRFVDMCPECKEEQRVADEYQTTRWPAGAEL